MNINAKAIRRGVMAIAAVAAVGALGACSTGLSSNAAPAPQGSSAASAPQASGGAGIGAAPNSAALQSTNTKGAPGADGRGVANAGGHPTCTNLEVTHAPGPDLINGSKTQWKLPIMLTNQSSVPCTVRGFPGVRLEGADGTTWDLVRTNAPSAPVLLGSGEHATADLIYTTAVPYTGTGGGIDFNAGWHVSSFAVTPPNSTNTRTMPWVDSVGLVKQDGATHPGTYIGPVRPSAAG